MKVGVECYPMGELGANCYIVTDESGEMLVVDPGVRSEKLNRRIQSCGADQLRYILLTHGHFDHIGGVAALKQAFPSAKIIIGQKDAVFTEKDNLNLSLFFEGSIEHFTPDLTVQDGDRLPFADGAVEVIATPGHTEGGMCYVIGDCIFTGDTLISMTTGRTDFPTGSAREMRESMHKLAGIPEDLKVYCGHGESSMLEYERLYNPFMG